MERAELLVDRADGKAFNRPNDLVVDRKGGVFFTDPGGRQVPGQTTAVYYLSPSKELRTIDASVGLPNGIQLSPDERTLYVADTSGEHVHAYDVDEQGGIGARRNFARLALDPAAGSAAAGADGLAVDRDGRLFVATALGVQIFDSEGNGIGVIRLPKRPQNMAFAGKGKNDLFVVGQGSVFRIHTLTQGVFDPREVGSRLLAYFTGRRTELLFSTVCGSGRL